MTTEHQTTNSANPSEGASGNAPVTPPAIRPASSPLSNFLLWPLLAAASVNQASAHFFKTAAAVLSKNYSDDPGVSALPWTTSNSIVLELSCMRLRDFSTHAQGQPTLICAPYVLHGSTVADFAPGHSVVEALQLGGLSRVFVTDWRSASPEMRYFSIDNYLADLNVAVDALDRPVDLVGLCQGGWLALVYAARFPEKVRKLVLAGAPVDVRAGESHLSRLAASVPIGVFEELVGLGDGIVLGHRMLELLGPALDANGADHVLQVPATIDPVRLQELHERFRQWNTSTVDLPGVFYLQISRWLFKENQIAEGSFVALGRRINLAEVNNPIFLLAADNDELVSVDQLFGIARLISTPKAFIEMATEPCGHLSLFLGAKVLDGTWRRIADWLAQNPATTPHPANDTRETRNINWGCNSRRLARSRLGEIQHHAAFNLAGLEVGKNCIDTVERRLLDFSAHLALGCERDRFVKIATRSDNRPAHGDAFKYHVENWHRELTRRKAHQAHGAFATNQP
jgi:poly(3-hydroxyalkanoate) synthetase